MTRTLTALAQLIELLAEKGITSTPDLVARTGYTDRAIRKAKAELECRNQGSAGTIVPEPECRSGTRVPQTEPGCRNQGSASRAYIESPSGIDSPKIEQKESPKPPKGASDDFWKSKLNPADQRASVIRTEAGSIQLLNGTRQLWLEKFGNDAERLDLALIAIAGEINETSRKPLAADVQARLARMAGQIHDQNKRYQAAAAANKAAQAKPSDNARPIRMTDDDIRAACEAAGV